MTMEKPVPWRSRFPGETGSLEKPVPRRNRFHGETGFMEKPVPWRNRFHGETGSMEKPVPWRNCFLGETGSCLIDISIFRLESLDYLSRRARLFRKFTCCNVFLPDILLPRKPEKVVHSVQHDVGRNVVEF